MQKPIGMKIHLQYQDQYRPAITIMKKNECIFTNKFMRQINNIRNQKSCTQTSIQIKVTSTIKRLYENYSKNNERYQQAIHGPEKGKVIKETLTQM